MLSELLGSTVRFEPISQQQWRDELAGRSADDPESVVNPAMAQHISSICHAVSHGAPTVPADSAELGELIGRAPWTLQEFLTENQTAFSKGGELGAPEAPSRRAQTLIKP